MHLSELRIDDLRNIERLEWAPERGWNVLIGPNGAGKTSVLEAVFLLSHGRSFRGGTRDALSRIGSDGYAVFGHVVGQGGAVARVGLARSGRGLEARIGGESCGLAELTLRSAAVCFEPGSHDLIDGASDVRRRCLDWGLFHVEPRFLACWRRYQRAIRQRNVVLRAEGSDRELEPWEHEAALAGAELHTFRTGYVDALRPFVLAMLGCFLPELGAATLDYQPGWDADHSLAEALVAGRARDRVRGHSGRGPHRADWQLAFEAAPRREHLSRGQTKLCALAVVLAQAELHAARRGEWPIVLLDDLASELDEAHQTEVVRVVSAGAEQVFVTGTALPAALRDPIVAEAAMFHVEQGRLRRLL